MTGPERSADAPVAEQVGSAGRHADDVGAGPVLASLTRPGGEFPLVDAVIGGVTMRVYDRAPRTLRDLIAASLGWGDRPFLVYGGERCTYAEHLAVVNGLAAVLPDIFCLERGDRVAIAMRNYPEWPAVFFAAQVAGMVAVPLNAWWSGPELAWAVAHSGAKLVVADSERAAVLGGLIRVPLVRVRAAGEPAQPGVLEWADLAARLDTHADMPDVDVRPEHDATILYTSGTTGRPKGAVHTHLNHVTNALNVALTARATAIATAASPPPGQPGTLLTYPMFHMAGLNGMYGAALGGAKLATMYRWDREEALRLIRDEGLTAAAGVPTTMREVAELAIAHRAETVTLSRIGIGGAPVPRELVSRIAERIGPIAANGYGLTETTSAVCANTGQDLANRPDSVGRVAPGTDLRVVDPVTGTDLPDPEIGELWVRGPNLVRGYWADPASTAEAFIGGWFRTGDLGFRQDGWIHVVDRLKDVVLRGGENVYSVQVEAALNEVPGVAEAAVVGSPHPTLGEEVVAVIRTDGGVEVELDELRRHVTERVGSFAAPAELVRWEGQFPRTATGKVIKKVVREAIRQRPPSSGRAAPIDSERSAIAPSDRDR